MSGILKTRVAAIFALIIQQFNLPYPQVSIRCQFITQIVQFMLNIFALGFCKKQKQQPAYEQKQTDVQPLVLLGSI